MPHVRPPEHGPPDRDPDGTNAVEARWERAGRPWCSHPWVVRVRRGEEDTGCLSCRLCGARWGAGDEAPPPRGGTESGRPPV